MRNLEVLAPAGDKKSFMRAIQSGADAIYFGLNKFNARMRADNIDLESLGELVEYAHMKGVRLYLTINTLIEDKEMSELVDMVGKCILLGVDAFIVQDYGVICVLKTVYPNIVLHGSTQLGVHNVRGAKVAKSLGLSRVVLSREVSLEDIRKIAEAVDIELEVFVQGAMCVCFSGNCYLSSIKHGASGNKGLCKQLCRLPYTLSDKMINGKTNQKTGYMISPRDNCMIDYMDELINLGVCSFKIEGRLRRDGYVAVATSTYREKIDSIIENEKFDNVSAKKKLSKVFSRGEFVSGYFDGNNIIEPIYNSHMGERIGVIESCSRFKDIYKIIIRTSVKLSNGDGLKIVQGNNTITLGVGNVEYGKGICTIFSKNNVQLGGIVYRVLDAEFENIQKDNSKYRVVDFEITALIGNRLELIAQSCGKKVRILGDIVERAKSKSTTEQVIIEQVSKVGKDFWSVGKITTTIDEDIFLPLSSINDLRRKVLSELQSQILDDYKIEYIRNEMPQITKVESIIDKIAIVDENNSANDIDGYDAIIISPREYSINTISVMIDKYRKIKEKVLVNLPIIALHHDLEIIDKIVNLCKRMGIGIVANNIYALDYIREGLEVFAGANMNVVSNYSVSMLNNLGTSQIVGSIEKWCQGIQGLYKMNKGGRVLMTLATCPHKALGKSCENGVCPHFRDMQLSDSNNEFCLRRYKVHNCYFELVDKVNNEKFTQNIIDDLRICL